MNNSDIIRRSLDSVWHPCTQMKQHETLPLVPFSRGKGVWLYDFEGKRYLDAVSSWWVNLFGHCNERINAALTDQLGRLEHAILAGFTHEPVVQLSERLSGLAPEGLGHAFYASDGASAIEIALKMSFHYWKNTGNPQKRKFVSLENGYHGETIGALAVTDVAIFKDTYSPLILEGMKVKSPDFRLAETGESPLEYAMRAAAELELLLEARHREIAAFVVEPLVQGAAGMAMHHPVYLEQARRLCDRYEIHLVADEIAVGFGRTGTFFACEQAGISPDFLCLSKGITGGYLPLSTVLCREEIYRAFYDDSLTRAFLHSHSYTGNALACRAALAVLDIFEEDDVLAANRIKAEYLNGAAAALREHPKVENFRNTGMIWAFEVKDAGPSFSRDFSLKAQEAGLLLRPIGNTVYFMPPYAIETGEIRFLVESTLSLL
ncbi:MAG: adenosylmethionine--8-amino-7-oxononanoate transaminase [Burkholderiales bacterium]|nr:adenosylmethionine--8-amino-7-oxononanoate transaminase [Burkholderiales bacterium]